MQDSIYYSIIFGWVLQNSCRITYLRVLCCLCIKVLTHCYKLPWFLYYWHRFCALFGLWLAHKMIDIRFILVLLYKDLISLMIYLRYSSLRYLLGRSLDNLIFQWCFLHKHSLFHGYLVRRYTLTGFEDGAVCCPYLVVIWKRHSLNTLLNYY